jgi:small subunit ribosomal protein S8
MSLNDPLASVLSHILNYEKLGKNLLVTKSNSRIIKRVLAIMREKGYLGVAEEIKDSKGNMLKINLIGKINRCGVIKPRFQVTKDDYEKYEQRFLPAKGFGIIIVSTNKGMMTHNEAKEKKIGGKLISYAY